MERNSIHKEVLLLFLTVLLVFGGLQIGFGQTTNVWPGDVNENGVVNNVDLLYLGIRLGTQGTARDSVSIEWLGQTATEWTAATTLVPNACHADCNGNSIVEVADRAAIDQNYGWERGIVLPDSSSLKNNSSVAAPLTFKFSDDPLVAGNTDTIFFDLGSDSQPVDSLLGFSATMVLDSNLVDSAYFWVEDEWFGTDAENLIIIDHYEPGLLTVAVTRTDGLDTRLGKGGLGGVVVVMADNLKQSIKVDSMTLQFDDALGITSRFGIAEFSINPAVAKVYSTELELEALIYPVPSTDGLNIKMVSLFEGDVAGTLYDLQGSAVREFTVSNELFRLEREGLQSGVYLLNLRRGESFLTRRILFTQ